MSELELLRALIAERGEVGFVSFGSDLPRESPKIEPRAGADSIAYPATSSSHSVHRWGTSGQGAGFCENLQSATDKTDRTPSDSVHPHKRPLTKLTEPAPSGPAPAEVLWDELRRLAKRRRDGVEEGVLRSWFIQAYDSRRRVAGQSRLTKEEYVAAYAEALAVLTAGRKPRAKVRGDLVAPWWVWSPPKVNSRGQSR